MSIAKGNTVQIHYLFNNEAHLMDAFVQNKCEREFLELLTEVAKSFSQEFTIETEPFAEGGLRRYFKILFKKEDKKAIITRAIVLAIATNLVTAPIVKISEKLIDKIFEDTELKELEKEKLKLEIKKLKEESVTREELLLESSSIKKRRSNFYDQLSNYNRVEEVSFQIEANNKPVEEEKVIPRARFHEFILSSDELEPTENEEAVIEIISPVLKKGKYKWTGIYNSSQISFSMKSKEFKNIIQTGKVEFKNGSSIKCHLKVKRKIDQDGNELNYGHEVLSVIEYFENDSPIETTEGKRIRKEKEADKNQMKLFNQKSS